MVPSPSDVTRIRYVAALVIRLGALWYMISSFVSLVYYVIAWITYDPNGFSLGLTQWGPTVVYSFAQIAVAFVVFWFAPKLARFLVRVPNTLACPKCGYDVTSIRERACPECGLALDEKFGAKDAS